MNSEIPFAGEGRDRGFLTMVCLLLLAVLVPTGCVLYFMNEAIGREREAAARTMSEAYAVTLRGIADSIDALWQRRSADLERVSESDSPAAWFERAVTQGFADAVICLAPDGTPLYPAPPQAPAPDPTEHAPEWIAAREQERANKFEVASQAYSAIAANSTDEQGKARALQAMIRCLRHAGRRDAAISAIRRHFETGGLMRTTDLQGRVIGADELLLAIHVLPETDPNRRMIARRLHQVVATYSGSIMPSPQRVFLMGELRALKGGEGISLFPTYGAERLALAVLESDRLADTDTLVRAASVIDVWKMASTGKRVIGLYRTNTVAASARPSVGGSGNRVDYTVSFTVLASPLGIIGSGSRTGSAAISFVPPVDTRPAKLLSATPASASVASKTVTPGELMVPVPRIPGWRVRMPIPGGTQPAGVASRQTASYIWVGSLTIALMVTLAVLAGRALRRQMRVTRLKTDLVAAVSHELKTPLASMQLLVDSLLETEPLDPVRTREYLQLVARENTRLNRLIENFLTFSRMENARGKFEFVRARPEDVVHGALESVAGRFPVQVDIEPGLPSLHADVDALVTVLLNLLDNAFKYTGDNKHIELRAYATHDRLCFEVRDNGIGIAPRDQKRVFRRFFQVDRALSRQTGGVGLGLSIVEFIVKAHGGTVSVFSQPGIGSRFTVSLPFVAESKEVAV